MNVSAQPLSRGNIRDIALELRKIVGLRNSLYFPIVPFIEYLLEDVFGCSYLIVSENEMNDAYGLTNTGNREMRIREDVYLGAVNGNPRDRFTLCHELGHFLLHQPTRISFARGDIPKYCQPEWQANTFAGELMAPYHLIKDMTVDEIAEKCGMSWQAAQIQHKMCHR